MSLSKNDKAMVLVLACGAFLTVFNLTLLSPAFPAIMNSFNITATTVQWLTSAYSLTEAIVIPLSAWFIGRFKTRYLYIGSMALFTAGSFIAGLAPAFSLLLVGRITQAAATGVLMPMVMTNILLIFPKEKRGLAMGLVGLIIACAPAIGPSLGGLLVDTVGWRYIYVFVIACALILIVVSSKALTNSASFERTRFDAPSVVLSSLGLVSLLYGLSTFSSSGYPLLSIAPMIVGISILYAFVRRQLSLKEPLLKVGVLAERNFRIAILTIVILQAALIGNSVVMPLFVQTVLGYSVMVSGLVMLPGTLLGAISGLIAGRLYDKHGVRILALIGSGFLLIGGVGLSLFQIDSSILLVCAVNTIIGFSMQMLTAPVNTWGINSLDNNVIQHANALSNTLNQVAGSFGSALIVSLSAFSSKLAPQSDALSQAYMGYHLSFIGVAFLLVICFAVVAFSVRDRKKQSIVSAVAVTERW